MTILYQLHYVCNEGANMEFFLTLPLVVKQFQQIYWFLFLKLHVLLIFFSRQLWFFLVFVQSCLLLMKLWVQSKIKVLELNLFLIHFFISRQMQFFPTSSKVSNENAMARKIKVQVNLIRPQLLFIFMANWVVDGLEAIVYVPTSYEWFGCLAGTACLWTSTFTAA